MRSLNVLLIVVLTSCTLTSVLGMSAKDEFGSFLRKLPRYDYNGGFDPKDVDYWKSLGALGLPFFVLSILAFMSWFFCMCCYCGCFRQTKDNVSTATIYCTRGTLIVCGLLVIISGGVNMYSNVEFHKTSGKVVEPLLDVTDHFLRDLSKLGGYLNEFNATGDAAKELESMYKLINQTNSGGKTVDKTVNDIELRRYEAFSVIFGCAIVAGALSLIGAIFTYKVLVLMGIFGLLTLPFTWFLVGFLVPLDTFFADACPNLQTYIANSTSDVDLKWAEYYLSCAGANPLSDVLGQADDKLSQAKEDLQEAIASGAPQYEIEMLQQIVWDFENVTYYLTDMTNCTMTSDAWNDFYMLCTDVFNDTLWIMIASIICAFFTSFAVCIGCWKHKVFAWEQQTRDGYLPLHTYSYSG